MTDNTTPTASTVADQIGSGFRSTLIAVCAGLASWLLHDGAVTAAVVVAVPAVMTAIWGVYRWRKTGHKLSDLAKELLN